MLASAGASWLVAPARRSRKSTQPRAPGRALPEPGADFLRPAQRPFSAQPYDAFAGRRMTYAAPAPAPNSASTETAVATQVVPSHWPP